MYTICVGFESWGTRICQQEGKGKKGEIVTDGRKEKCEERKY